MEKIDFVLTWVDGSDPDWLAQRREYQPGRGTDAGESRYRDWDNLQYWFRGMEKFAPWVNKIYFVTWGHFPKWLNTAHEKIQIVKHEDFMAPAYLPTFNINSIELNFHRIKGLRISSCTRAVSIQQSQGSPFLKKSSGFTESMRSRRKKFREALK